MFSKCLPVACGPTAFSVYAAGTHLSLTGYRMLVFRRFELEQVLCGLELGQL